MVNDMSGALCAQPEHLELVDAAFARPGGPAARELRDRLCVRCPVAATCLDEGMQRPEFGVWGGTSQNLRTQHGAPVWRSRGKSA